MNWLFLAVDTKIILVEVSLPKLDIGYNIDQVITSRNNKYAFLVGTPSITANPNKLTRFITPTLAACVQKLSCTEANVDPDR